ncbi:MAG TPA: Hpt domain-containing protein, partial [Anaeromyxobacteraceae bacterium]
MAERSSQKALAEFVSEAQETIEALDADLARLEQSRREGEPDQGVLNAVFRAAHSLKGLAAMFGVDRMAGLAHALEDRLDDVRMGRQPLDGPTLDLLLAAPEIFTRITAEEGAQEPPRSAEAAGALAEQLRQRPAAGGGGGADPLAALEIDEGMLQVLTEYEEHRLRANVQRGAHLWRVRAVFDLATFDTGLEALKGRLKPHGEVVCALPSADPGDPGGIGFDVLLASTEGGERIRAAAAPAVATEVARRAAAAAPARPAAPAAPSPGRLPPAPAVAPPPGGAPAAAAPPPAAAPGAGPPAALAQPARA